MMRCSNSASSRYVGSNLTYARLCFASNTFVLLWLQAPDEKSVVTGAAGSAGSEWEQRRMKMLELLDVIRVMIPDNPQPIPPEIGGVKTAQCKVCFAVARVLCLLFSSF
jgi:hypothetical protein